MSLNADLIVRTGRYLDGEYSLADLANWIQEHEPHWAALPPDAVARILADTIMLAVYEVDDGVRNEESVKELVSEAALQTTG